MASQRTIITGPKNGSTTYKFNDKPNKVSIKPTGRGYTLLLRGNNDSGTGSRGNDVLDGGTDNDTIMGGEQDDTMTGGQGADKFVFSVFISEPEDEEDGRLPLPHSGQATGRQQAQRK